VTRRIVASLLVALSLSSPATAQKRIVKVELSVEGRGQVMLDLYPTEAPKTVDHIVNLCKSKFYDGILVHRVEPGFVVQAGDPQTKRLKPSELASMSDARKAELRIGAGGSGKTIPFEKNSLTHVPGTIAMALSAPRSATGDSQWFINLESNHQLDGDYCVFGKVTKGMDVVRKIRVGDRIKFMRVVETPTASRKPKAR
jgi:cyclophilin family peptidyl-prolyl cis-trans isomerase